jgi:predicted small lipoprotein YifL
MEQMKTRSVGARAHRSQPPRGKALMGLMLSLALVGVAGLSACGQKRPLQLPQAAKTAGTGSAAPMTSSPAATVAPGATATPASVTAASAPASAAIMPQR